MLKITNNIIGDFFMKKKISVFLLTIVYILLMSCTEMKANDIRLRILANSNSESDQIKKNNVKDFLKEYLCDKNLNTLNLIELETILNNKFEDNIKVERKYVMYEAKSYNNKIIQSGKYDTILITIDEGLGKNFWTLLYPEYFNISFEEENEIEYRSYLYDIIFNSYK